MAFLNALGRVRRLGQWRLRLPAFRVTAPEGRPDLTDAGLLDFSATGLVRLTVSPRPPQAWCGGEPESVLSASTLDGTLTVASPGHVEALFPDGWSACIRPGLYDVRVFMTVGPETALIFEQPVEIV